MSEVSTLVAGLVAESPEPLVASIRVARDVPYRFVNELQNALVSAHVVRVVFHVEGATSAPDGGDGLAILLPDWEQDFQVVSQRNLLKLTVTKEGWTEVRRGEAVQVQQIRADQVGGLWRQTVLENPDLIAVLGADHDATYTQVMTVLDALKAADAQRIALLAVTAG